MSIHAIHVICHITFPEILSSGGGEGSNTSS
jgi:hypothetical protein